jgi:hypothetical protein
MYTIFCLLEGEYTPFSVHIDQTRCVADLKKAIKEKCQVTFAAVDANNLKLYHVNFEYDDSDEEKCITQVNEVLQGLSNAKPLRALQKLSKIEKGFPQEIVHILVRLPPSESIHSMACGAVAETPPPNTLHPIICPRLHRPSNNAPIVNYCATSSSL